MKKGFTIIELLVVILVISISIVGSYTVVGRIFAVTSVISLRLPAVYLAQEGIEIVRNIRDSNWVNSDNWDDGLPFGDFEADYTDLFLSDSYFGNKLKINNNIYTYSGGTDSIYDRKITLSSNGSGSLNVSVTVNWISNGSNHNISVEENIYDWK